MNKLCMIYVNHTYENKRVCKWENTLIKIIFWVLFNVTIIVMWVTFFWDGWLYFFQNLGFITTSSKTVQVKHVQIIIIYNNLCLSLIVKHVCNGAVGSNPSIRNIEMAWRNVIFDKSSFQFDSKRLTLDNLYLTEAIVTTTTTIYFSQKWWKWYAWSEGPLKCKMCFFEQVKICRRYFVILSLQKWKKIYFT